MDGAYSNRTAWTEDPYPGSDDHGIHTLADDELRAAVAWARRNRVQVAVHAMGDRALNHVLDMFADEEPWMGDLPSIRLDHATLFLRDDRPGGGGHSRDLAQDQDQRPGDDQPDADAQNRDPAVASREVDRKAVEDEDEDRRREGDPVDQPDDRLGEAELVEERILMLPTSAGIFEATSPPSPTSSATWRISGRSLRVTLPCPVPTNRPLSSTTLIRARVGDRVRLFPGILEAREVPITSPAPFTATPRRPLAAGPAIPLTPLGRIPFSSWATSTFA